LSKAKVSGTGPKNNLHFEKAYDTCAAYDGLLDAHDEE
jgi:hypothetical protein